MRIVILAGLLTFTLSPALAQEAQPLDLDKAACSQLLSVRPGKGYTAFSDAITDYVLAKRGDSHEFGSSCNMIAYAKAECRSRPKASVQDALSSLFVKADQKLTLPKVGRCGA